MAEKKIHRRTLRCLSVVLSILFLWGFGISLLVVILNVNIGFTDNNADFRSAFLSMTEAAEHEMLEQYLQLSQTAAYSSTAGQSRPAAYNRFSESSLYSGSVGLAQNLHTFEGHFDPKNTNFRFAATDTDGNLLLTNDPNYGEEQPVLASEVHTTELVLEQRSYQIQKHFDDAASAFGEIVYGNPSQYLDAPENFQLWYFTNDAVDAAYHDGLDIRTYDDLYTDYLFFDSQQDAESFDYTAAYGDHSEWHIAASAAMMPNVTHTDTAPEDFSDEEPPLEAEAAEDERAANDAEADDLFEALGQNDIRRKVLVEITAYNAQEQLHVPLESYYDMKGGGTVVYAADSALESLLMNGLDITIRAERTETAVVYIRSYLPEELPIHDTIRNNYAVFSFLFRHSEWSVILMFVLLVLTVISAMVMCTTAGHPDDSERIAVPRVHSIAYEFFWLLPPLSFAASFGVLYVLSAIGATYRIIAIFCTGMILCIAACCILWLFSTAVRSKAGTFWSSFGLVRLLGGFFGMFRNRTVTMITVSGWMILLLLLNISVIPDGGWMILPMVGVDLLTLLLLIYCIYAYFELHRHVREMETGDFTPASHPIPLGADFARFDNSLNDITSKVGDIVAQQTKAEHLRTELITNVSHDLKTPLTSIVNYVDLLSREPMQTETAAEYLEVLKRQAARLKKLTVDLIDASKASTGNLTVELMPTDLLVLISQLAGEYQEQMEANHLELMLNVPEEPLMILADGRQIWRVFDNLLNNACKYALTGTRIYLDIEQQDDFVMISLKNISAQPLNVSPDTLMERFNRGDASRHTEGSGLGLSIARDLTALQNGILTLSTDGDLFKAHLTFPLYHPQILLEDAELL